MHKFVKGCLLMLASFSFFAVVGTTTGQAASKTVALPKSYRGTWYAYLVTDRTHHVKYYYTYQLRMTDRLQTTKYGISSHTNLSHATTQATTKIGVTYQRTVSKKNRVSYRVRMLRDQTSLGKYWLTTVKVQGKPTTALAWDDEDGDDVVYAFRKLQRTHCWNTFYF
ncbi:hypothetical protein [Levilactobacillus cerevisiae]|uniref:hypothetical protein n=1 Tax=Levilactobacillus cerevisiae TaxID=1704076 RepID=UPI000F781548|nr:hypothetical protein [Levilactobacillus cerevisiae]